MSQEEKDLVDPQDDIDYGERRKKKEASKENLEEDSENQDEVYGSDAKMVDPKEEEVLEEEKYVPPSKRTQEVNVFIVDNLHTTSFGSIFCKNSSSHRDLRKKARKGKEVLETDFSKEYNRLSARKVLPAKWVDEGFLTAHGLSSDFTTLVGNAGMDIFSSLNCDMYKRATLEFLSTSHELDITEGVVQEVSEAWRHISVHKNLNYLRKKSATIQNPTIHYFAAFLANSLFGKGDTGAMASPEMSVICSALYPDMENRMNLSALLIQHFHRQKSANSGKNTWVLSPEEFHALRVVAGRAPAPGGDAVWEQHNDQAGNDDHQWGGQGWDDYGQDHQYQQYQQPPPQPYMQPQPGYDYVSREEYDTLVSRVGELERTLHDVNANVLSLT
ncbi:hypothetical protein QYE76_039074 [Lolium multiflorum]|uniref:Arabidopsis retrotransposon Orf1 C-terminal domain-containing protein n=1 Tax=Lolium multiflorum TaxID=4521 RepID=A0AAD8WTI9_LOLMU|nr:hypothetical protein QYE76_039074 [Lolium multiflorum]